MNITLFFMIILAAHYVTPLESMSLKENPSVDEKIKNLCSKQSLFIYECKLTNPSKEIVRFPFLKLFSEKQKIYIISHCKATDEECLKHLGDHVFEIFTSLETTSNNNCAFISLERFDSLIAKTVNAALDTCPQKELLITPPTSNRQAEDPLQKKNLNTPEHELYWSQRNPKKFGCCMIGLGALGFWCLQKLSALNPLGSTSSS